MTREPLTTVIGAGSWGTTVASLAAANLPTTVWAREPELAEEIDRLHTNGMFLPSRSSTPFTRLTTGIHGRTYGAARARTSRKPSEGTAITSTSAGATASSSELVARSCVGSSKSVDGRSPEDACERLLQRLPRTEFEGIAV